MNNIILDLFPQRDMILSINALTQYISFYRMCRDYSNFDRDSKSNNIRNIMDTIIKSDKKIDKELLTGNLANLADGKILVKEHLGRIVLDCKIKYYPDIVPTYRDAALVYQALFNIEPFISFIDSDIYCTYYTNILYYTSKDSNTFTGRWKRQSFFVHEEYFTYNDFQYISFISQFKKGAHPDKPCDRRMRIIIILEDSSFDTPIIPGYHTDCIEMFNLDYFSIVEKQISKDLVNKFLVLLGKELEEHLQYHIRLRDKESPAFHAIFECL